ncbi:MAG: NUDIX domain-containing protein [Opitutaceae bacterium]|nr:NUDIX domain-containing protein [Opitutaceae bacterium]
MSAVLPHKLSVLVFLQDPTGRQLLIERAKAPNAGQWSPIGGKLETGLGESPHQCAARETLEEVGLDCAPEEFHLFAMIAERAYEGGAHWLMFLFTCRRTVDALPPAIAEGRFGFFTREELERLPLPETDRTGLWPIYDRHREGFVALRADCTPGKPLHIEVEEVQKAPAPRG